VVAGLPAAGDSSAVSLRNTTEKLTERFSDRCPAVFFSSRCCGVETHVTSGTPAMTAMICEDTHNTENHMIAARARGCHAVLVSCIAALGAGGATTQAFNPVRMEPPAVERKPAATSIPAAVGTWTRKPAEFKEGSAILKGTMFIPDGESHVPGVVILGGSERGPRTRLKERLAEHFAGAGVAALIYDSAGTGESTGNALLQTREVRAKEAIAAVRCLRSETRTHPDQVGISGISEGALVTMLATARDDSVAFAIPVSGGFGVSIMELARYRIEVKSLIRGLKPEQTQKALLLEELLFALMAGPDFFEWRLMVMKAARWPNESWDELADIVKTMRRATSPTERQEKWDALRRTVKTFRSEPWFDLVVVDVGRFDRFMSMSAEHFYAFLEKGPLANGDFDKVRQELGQYPKVRCPVLAVWGENDEFLPPHRTAAPRF
jgi:pimeloyl-ACP methyl ester carboxylesterase